MTLLDVVYYGNQADTAYLGVGQGLEDCSLPEHAFRLCMVEADSIAPINDPVPLAIFASADAETLRILSQLNPGVPVFNLIEEYDDLRTLCLHNLLHITPSRQMRINAVRLWQEQHVNLKPVALAWHSDWNNFNAADLNSLLSDQTWLCHE